MTQWIATPEQIVELNHGKGANVVTGSVRIAFTGAGRAYVATRAHNNDDAPAVVVRGKSYLVTLHFVRQADGTWTEHKHNSSYNVSPRGSYDPFKAAAPTIRAAIVAALLNALTEADSGDVERSADHAQAAQQLVALEPRRVELAAKLAALDAEIAHHQAILAATAPEASHAG